MEIIEEANIEQQSYNGDEMVEIEPVAAAQSHEQGGASNHRQHNETVGFPSGNLAVELPEDVPPVIMSKEEPPGILPRNQRYIQQHPFTTESPRLLETRSQPSIPVFAPFCTLEDFLQAEIFDRSEASIDVINTQLKLVQQIQGETSRITLKSAVDLRETLDRAIMFDEDRFHRREVVVNVHGQDYAYTLHFRNIVPAIRDLLADSNLTDDFVFDPQRHFIQRDDGLGNDRVYEEYFQCDDFWDLRTSIGSALGTEAYPLPIFIYSDETQLTNFGNNTIWSVYFWLGNLPHRVRASFGRGGATMLAYLPKGHHPNGMRNEDLSLFRSKLFHQCFQIMLAPLLTASRFGDRFRMGDGSVKTLVPVISVKLGDYPELCRMTGVISKDCVAACPAGMLPTRYFHRTGVICPPRDHELEEAAIDKALGLMNGNEIPSVESLGIRAVRNAFNPFTNHYFAGYRTVGADGLHWVKQGVFGRVWFHKLLKELTPSLKKQMDYCFKNLPRYPGLSHFAQGVTSLGWRSGSDHTAISRTLVPILECILPSKMSCRDKILRLFRLLSECMTLMSFSMHTDSTLALLQDVLENMANCETPVADQWGVNLKTPKHHFMHSHLIESIKAKGPVCNTDTGIGEARHPESKHAYARTNHHPDTVKDQMIRHVVHREVIRKIRARIDQQASETPLLTPLNDPVQAPDLGCHVAFGSPDRLQTLYDLLKGISVVHKLGFWELKEGIKRYLKQYAPSLRLTETESSDDDEPADIWEFRATNYKKADIEYVSLENFHPQRDIIRVNPNWRRQGPRYDYILINRDHQSVSCVQVLALFKVLIRHSVIPIVLVRPVKVRPRSVRHGFYSCTPTDGIVFVPPGSIIRSAYVQSHTISKENKLFINDAVDSDMFLRLKYTRLVSY
ncbi:hypothetical protein FRC19_008882 [Serendipita sp. 401]|nr:hypothetical protein FRC19_008882 [Serendipita sp. 401]KAG9053225.1 hypothetical protein FS842_008482 [Serendipita sp. 407]